MTMQIRPDNPGNMDLGSPDGKTIIWPTPRSMKIDMATVLEAAFQGFNFGTSVKVVTTGAFEPALLRDSAYLDCTVLVLQRSSDVQERDAVGEIGAMFTITDVETGAVLDPDAVLAALPPGEEVVMKDAVSVETVDLWIFDENEQRIEQMYLLVKTIFFAARQTFLNTWGYKDFIRVNGQDSASMETNGGNFIVFQRNMVYQGRHLDFLAGVTQLANLISETYTVSGGPTTQKTTVDL